MKRIFVTFLTVVLISFSVGSSYMCASQVEAAEIGLAAAGGSAAWEYIAALLASLGLGAAVADNGDEIVDTFLDAWQERALGDAELGKQLVDGCMYVYDSAVDSVRALPWDEFMDSLSNFHDNAVDNLTDLYVHFCPELLGSWSDFLTSIVNGDTYVEGISEQIQSLDGTFTDYESIQNPDGTYHVTGYMYNVSPTTGRTFEYILDGNVADPVCVYKVVNYYYYKSYVGGRFYNTSVSADFFDNGEHVKFNEDGYTVSNFFYDSYDVCYTNVPIFESQEAALAAFAADDFSSAINFSAIAPTAWPWYQPWEIGDDLPFWDVKGLLDGLTRVAPDVIYGPWTGAGYYNPAFEDDVWDDLPFWNVGALDTFEKAMWDFIRKLQEGSTLSLDGDIPWPLDTTWDDVYVWGVADAWDDVVADSLPGVIDDSTGLVVPGELPGVLNPDKPITDDPAKAIDDALADAIDDAIDIADPVPGLVDDFSGFGLSLKDKFPFCIPWDIYYLLTKLSEAPKTPVFKLPLYLPRYGIHEDIVIDLSPFESVSKLSRAFLSLLFAFGLIKMTISFVGMIDDNVTT